MHDGPSFAHMGACLWLRLLSEALRGRAMATRERACFRMCTILMVLDAPGVEGAADMRSKGVEGLDMCVRV